MTDRCPPLCRLHPDFHMPPDVDIGANFDPDALARRLRPLGVDTFVVFAKCAYGYAYYPTKIGTPHPRLKRDMVGTAIEGFRRHGMDVPVYLNVFIDGQAAQKHPAWAVHGDPSTPKDELERAGMRTICVNSGYMAELLLPMARELVRGYEVDEVFMDTNPTFKVCYCEACMRLFGKPIPADSRDPLWPEYVRWYAERYERFFGHIAAEIHAASPDTRVLFNSKWGPDDPGPVPAHIGEVCQDLWASGLIATRYCRYFAGTGLPFDYMTGRFLHGLGDWNNNTQQSLRNTAASAIANGARFYLIDRMLPDGTLQEDSYRAMASVFPFVQERRQWVQGCGHVPELAIVTSKATVVGRAFEQFPDAQARKDRLKPADGACRLLAEHGRHFTTLAEHTAVERMAEYRCLIVPEQEGLSDRTAARLEQWVRGGGRLLLTQPTWSDDPGCFTYGLAGVRAEGLTTYEYGYIDAGSPVHVRGRFANVRPADCEVIAPAVLPMESGGEGRRFGLGLAPATRPSGYAAITCRELGKGTVIYVAGPVFRAYWDHQSPHLARILLSLIDRLVPDPLARVDTPAQVELSLLRKGSDLVIHIVNHAGRERLSGWVFPVTEYIPEIRGVTLRLRVGRRRPRITRVPSRRPVRYTVRDGYAVVKCPALREMESFVAPGYFR